MKIFQREQRSLFGEILDWMLTPLLLLWPISLILTWLAAQNLAGKPFDRAMAYNVDALSRLVTVVRGQAHFSLTQPARELLRAEDANTVYYQVLGVSREFLSGERNLPAPPADEALFFNEVRFRDAQMLGVDVKVAYTWVQLPLPDTRPVLVQVAETLEKRSLLATEIVKGVMLPQFVILPLGVLLIWLALVQAIKPLSQLEERIAKRTPDDLSPLETQTVPLEVVPLVASVNGLLLRLKDSIATQKRFLADAAHQLKTPLAGLRMQADLAQRENTDAQALMQSLRQIGHASIRATHTVNQLLALARAENSAQTLAWQTCDLAELTMAVVHDCVPRAIEKSIDLGYEGAQPGTTLLQGNAFLLQEMIRNLVDNALHYTPSHRERPGVITARVLAANVQGTLILVVEDSGPGVALAERELIFQPFYRALGTEADGSGLGLSIVLEIAKQHGARVHLEPAWPTQQAVGARFSVSFTAHTPAT